MTEPGEEHPADKDYALVSLFEQCVGSVRRLAAYAQEAQRDGSFDLAEFFRRAQSEARRRPGSTTRGDPTARREDQIVADEAVADDGPTNASHDDIAQRAYAISEREQGDDVENWLRAERELTEHDREAARREPESGAPSKR